MAEGEVGVEVPVEESVIKFSAELRQPIASREEITSAIQRELPGEWRGMNFTKLMLKLVPLLLLLTACGSKTDASSVNEKVASLLAEGDRSAETSGVEELADVKDSIGGAEFGGEVSAADALKQAIAAYNKNINPNLSDEEAREIAANTYSELNATTSCPTCNVVVEDEHGVYMANHWQAFYKYVDDNNPSTFVSDEINQAFSGSGKIYYFFEFSEAQSLLKELRDKHLPTQLDMFVGGEVQTLSNEAVYAAPGVINP